MNHSAIKKSTDSSDLLFRFSSDGKPESGGGSYFEHSLFCHLVKAESSMS